MVKVCAALVYHSGGIELQVVCADSYADWLLPHSLLEVALAVLWHILIAVNGDNMPAPTNRQSGR